ncbi:MAG: MmcQ/YjbR family DNA-binding protein [Planctomycetes bacterium]|nr:MmcQ/YjbR family DNA-binding protein [Planctomycetota bacterium]
MATARKKSAAGKLVEHLRALGLQKYPGAHTKSPWPGHLDLAVDDKTFAYLSAPGDAASVSLKLPLSCSIALMVEGAEPTGYGLGKSGWVSMQLDGVALPPVEQFEVWLDESYRAQAKKRRIAELDGVVKSSAKKTVKKAAKKAARR